MLSTIVQREDKKVLYYHNSIQTGDNLTLSIDNIVMDLYISNPAARDQLMALLDKLPIQNAVNVVHWTSFHPGTFREQFSIQHQDNTSFWLGVVLNSSKPSWGRCRLDFNPNKVAQHTVFQQLLKYLIQNTRPMHRKIKRFDLAVDIPIDRFSVFLVKDARAYIERRHGKEWTQYLGAKSSTVGRVKLYNKEVEAKLDYPLTRLELTLDPSVTFDKIPWPTVYYLQTLQVQMDEFKITDTERFILNALLQGFGSLNQLGRKTREKMERLLNRYVSPVEISSQDYSKVLGELNSYLCVDTKEENSNIDKPPPSIPTWVKEAEQVEDLDELPL